MERRQNQPAVTTPIEVLVCPSAPGGSGRIDQPAAGIRAAVSDYSAATAMTPQAYTTNGLTPPDDLRGIIHGDLGTRMAEVLDGLSNTIMVIEDAGRPDFWIHRPPPRAPLDQRRLRQPRRRGGRASGSAWADPMSDLPVHSFA